jgi:MFS family permease
VTTDAPRGTAQGGGGLIPIRRRLFLDLSPLRVDREYRKLWTGQVISVMGNQVTRIALPYQVYVLTGSPLAIAVLTAAQLLPILVLSLAAGSIADAFDRRKVLMGTQAGLALTNVCLIVVSLQPNPPIWAIYALAAVIGALLSLDWPARLAAVPRLVPRERLPSAIALTQLSQNMSAIVGPALGGIILAWVGPTGAFATDLAAFSISIWALIALAPIPPLHQTLAPGLTAIKEGLAFVRSRKVILGAFAVDLDAMVFGRPVGLFPILALDVFHAGAAGVGMLAAAPAVGAFIGALLSGSLSSIQRVGRAVVLSVMAWGTMVTLFGLSDFSFQVALVLLALSGAADVLSTMLRWTIVQTETPDQLRGRVTSINNMSVTSGPRLGDIRAATVATVLGAQAAVVTGGLMCLAGAILVTRAFPALWRHSLLDKSSEPDGPARPAGMAKPTGAPEAAGGAEA